MKKLLLVFICFFIVGCASTKSNEQYLTFEVGKDAFNSHVKSMDLYCRTASGKRTISKPIIREKVGDYHMFYIDVTNLSDDCEEIYQIGVDNQVEGVVK